MAQSKVLFSPSDFQYHIETAFGNSELLCSIKPKDFIMEVHQLMASKLADKILERLSPAIDKALAEISLEKEPK